MDDEGGDLLVDNGVTKCHPEFATVNKVEQPSESRDTLTNHLGGQMTNPLDVVMVECKDPDIARDGDNAMWDDDIDDELPDSKHEVPNVARLARIL